MITFVSRNFTLRNSFVFYVGKFAKDNLGDSIDFWINNAGSVAYKRKSIVDLEPDDLKQVIGTNMLGTMYCCKVAIDLMKNQKSKGKEALCILHFI